MGSVLCTWVKLLTDLQTVGCKLRAFGGRAPPLHAGAAIALPSRYTGVGKEQGKRWE